MGKTTLNSPPNLGYGQCSLFLPRLLFSTWGCRKEDRRQHRKRDALLSIRLSQVLCCICLQQKVVKFPLQLWRYRCVTETWLPWGDAIWSSNGANNVCWSFNVASAFYGISRGQRKKIRLFDWLGCQLLERDTNFTINGGRRSPAVISPQLILTEDQIILLDLVTPSRNSVLTLSCPRGSPLTSKIVWR